MVTGTALSGEVRVGDTLWLTGVNTPMRVRGLHAQNQAVEQAHAGQRIALNIVGDAQKRPCTAATGCSLTTAGASRTGDCRAAVPYAAQPVAAAAYSPCCQPHYRPGVASEGNLAELVLDTPLWLADNDRLVLRDISARLTLAGARVVTLDPPRRGKRKPEYLQWLHALAAVGADDAQALELHLQRMPSGLSTSPGAAAQRSRNGGPDPATGLSAGRTAPA